MPVVLTAQSEHPAVVPPADPSLDIVPTCLLLRRALRALTAPRRAFVAIRPGESLRFATAVPVLLAGGLFFFVFHSRFVVGTWVWQLPYAPMILAQYAMAGVWNWLIGGIVLHYVFRHFAPRRPSSGEIDVAVFYLWVTWALMPLLDVPHLFGVPTLPLVQRLPWRHFMLGHLSLLLTTPVRAVQLFFLLRALGRMRRAPAAALAAAMALGSRFLVEPSGALFFLVAERLGYHMNFWVGQYYLIAHSLLYTVFWRLALERRSWAHALARVAALTALVLAVTFGAWRASWAAAAPGVRPAPFELAAVRWPPARPLGAPGTGLRWTAPAGAAYEPGRFLDGANHTQALSLPMAPLSDDVIARLARIRCEVHVSADDGLSDDGYPWVDCFAATGVSPKATADLAGDARVVRTWTPADSAWPALLRELRSASPSLPVRLGVHGGGDYTQPDRLQIRDVRLMLETRP